VTLADVWLSSQGTLVSFFFAPKDFILDLRNNLWKG
jgi:hypothetical protein